MKKLSLKGKSITKETSKNNIRCMYAYVGGTVGFHIAKSVAISNICIKDVENG